MFKDKYQAPWNSYSLFSHCNGKSTRVRKKRLWVVGKEFTHGIVESTEIDLTELEEENLEDGDIGENGESSTKWR
ncbi:hypothetical protein L1987_77911 [Smallanthus sonchifolius]|uniref:Uncharacterized protein n=1 Tax=Smallanthus sonchifolius TaxID=185202 RepID=A0ACB8ZAB4_9ASTR|nr:hypothetical protein L1987_77911 [Smallanthus sonchifolius]